MPGPLIPLLLLACTTRDAAVVDASARLQAALDSGEVAAVSEAARAAAALEGRDPALDRLLGDALANHLLKPEDGARLLRANPAPGDPAWVRAATDAALRAGDRPWLGELLTQQGVKLDLEHPVVEQISRLASREREVDHHVLVDVVAACTLMDGRPTLGRRQVDLPVPDHFQEALRLLGATEVLVGRTALVYSPRTSQDRAWQCRTGWLSATDFRSIPTPLPPKGVLVVATDGKTTGYVELDRTREGPWATVSGEPELVARWLQAGAYLDELGDDPEAQAKVLARYGPGLALPEEG